MPLKTRHDESIQMNLTPMIDVVFNLIVFFMVATRFTTLERKLDVHVPKVAASGASTAAPTRYVINVYQDGTITLDRRLVTAERLLAELAAAHQRNPDVGVVVRGDGQGAFQNVATVLNACRQAGIAELGISVRMADTGKEMLR